MNSINIVKKRFFLLKNKSYFFIILYILETDQKLVTKQLNQFISNKLFEFRNIPIIIDFSKIKNETIDLLFLYNFLKSNFLYPFAIQGIKKNEKLIDIAKILNLAILNDSFINNDELIIKNNKYGYEKHFFLKEELQQNKLYTFTIRSGQQIINEKGDLIIVSSVNHGAELFASGNIHIYGTLRGKSLAGINGNLEARIFCQSLDAELLSIAGIYRSDNAIKSYFEPCQIYLKNNKIKIQPLC
ncbi:septum site-determining protein MinC [Candidatus Legionella polyplacis]|uniref:Probable septum site-determining protein MinC n=1 Tax=Candidatus Legionella polyplacis TaxID=2005262 RepID=A0ABZ2GVX7_9GAMM